MLSVVLTVFDGNKLVSERSSVRYFSVELARFRVSCLHMFTNSLRISFQIVLQRQL